MMALRRFGLTIACSLVVVAIMLELKGGPLSSFFCWINTFGWATIVQCLPFMDDKK